MNRIARKIFTAYKEILKLTSFFILKNFKDLPVELQIETTNICNAKCWFCPNKNLKRTKKSMSDEIFNIIIRRLQEENINVDQFILHINGEPLLDRKIFERVEKLRECFPACHIRFTTNFSMADDACIEKILNSSINEITISLNAMDSDEYYSIMKLLYDNTIRNIDKFMNRKLELDSPIIVNFSIVARSDNRETVEKFKDKYSSIGNIRVIYLGEWVNGTKPDEFEETKVKSGLKTCPILYRTINILSNGDFALCCFDAEGMIPLNIKSTSIKKAWCSLYFNKVRLYHLLMGKTNKECINCSFR